jgi:eukaryotic-like serine/threonine-protein kinase
VTALPSTLAAALADRYRIERELGAGGMATVYLAEDVRHHRKVAVKVLRPELAASMGPDRFLREIEIAAQLQHPHILPLLDSGDAAGFLFYVMPYVQGESLRDRLVRERELPVHDALRIITEVADALAHAHEHGVVHRDIKPENILLSGRHALVADFGVAKAVSEASGRLKLTSVGVALGTPTYMAPEQASADPGLDHRVDIYALGVVAYELLAGRPPFTGHTAQEVLAAHMTRPPEPIRNFRGNVAPAVETIVLRCLEKHPADRWQSTSELVSQLEPLATPSGGMTPMTTRPLAARSPGSRRWLVYSAVAAGVVLIATAVAFAATRAPPPLQLGRRTQVTLTAGVEELPVPTADGKAVAYAAFSWSDTAVRLELRRIEGGSAIPLGSGMWPLSWSPDGSQLLTGGRRRGLQIVPALGGPGRLLVPGVLFGAWSPDGKSVAYARGDSLFARPTVGGTPRLIARSLDPNGLAWSPDGKWLAFVSGNSSYRADWNVATSSLWLVDAAGGTPIRLTSSDHSNASPAWISSRRLVFVSDRDRGRDIYQLDLRRDGRPQGKPGRLTTGLNASMIGVSADRTRLAYSVARIRSNIWRLPLPAGGAVSARFAQPVTSGEQNIETFSISRDGRWLLFDSDRAGRQQIFRMPLSGGEIEPVTDDSFPAFAPQPSPDGKEVAYHSIGPKGYRRVFIKPWDGGTPLPVSPEADLDALAPRWADGSRLAWWSTPNFSAAGPGRFMVAARADGRWGQPTVGPPLLDIEFSGDGKQFVGYDSTRGMVVGSTGDDRLRTFLPVSALGSSSRAPIWAEDRHSVLILLEREGGSRIYEVPVTGGTPRELVRFDGPVQRSGKGVMVEREGHLYFTLGENESDLWVVELEGIR